jgi:uncharacterized protein (TIGR03437 family)
MFRQVIYFADTSGNVFRARALYGVINFDGSERYSLNGTLFETGSGTRSYSFSGSYSISASGYGFLQHPALENASLIGLAANGVFVGSSLESGVNDYFVAVRAGSANNATFSGPYALSYFNIGAGALREHYNALVELNPNGQGDVGTVRLKGYRASTGSAAYEQTANGVRYAFSEGSGGISFPTGQNLAIQGSKQLLISPDGNFVFGGSPQAADFFVGVRKASGAPAPFEGLYYTASIYEDVAANTLQTALGSIKASGGVVVGHKRYFAVRARAAYNFNYTDAYPAEPVGQFFNSSTLTDYIFSADGATRIGLGRGPFLAISVSVRAPEFSGSGVFLNPAGVVNAASSATFTAGVAPGELITLHGENLASGTTVASSVPFPASLGGVEVRINGRLAPVYYASPDQVAAVVPYATTETIAQIEVVNNGVVSNAVTAFVYDAQPGVFTIPPGGVGLAAALHANNTLVEPGNPAREGEIISVFMTGLGAVSPPVPEGAPGPVSPLSTTSHPVAVFIDNRAADVLFAGLAPTLAGAYQVNFRVPFNLRQGNVRLDVVAGRSYSTHALLPVSR